LEVVIGEEEPSVVRQDRVDLQMRNKTTSFIDKPPLPNEGGGGHQQGQLFRGEGFSTRGSAE
jgi:hypothetical protein